MFTQGIDQYGQHYDNLGKHPRKELLNRLGYSKAEKMYRDKKNGDTIHVGYIIGGLWIDLYTMTPLEVIQK